MSKTALIVIDVQNDYFAPGKFPLWEADAALSATEAAIIGAREAGMAVILVQHVANAEAPFFTPDSVGVAIHPRILTAAPEAPVVIKTAADAFLRTDLEAVLAGQGITELLICGMMTHNCVTHTALSKAAEKYQISVLADCCATVSQILNLIALKALSDRVVVKNWGE